MDPRPSHKASTPTPPTVLAILPAFIPSTTLTVVQPLTRLHRSGLITADITLEPWVSAQQVRCADVIVFCRNANGAVLDLALASGKPLIYNIDDNLLEMPTAYANHLNSDQAKQLRRHLAAADLVRAYSEHLRNYLLQFNANTEAVECAVDWDLVPESPPKRVDERVSIVYATSRWDKDTMASLFLDDLKQLLETHGERVRVSFWGYHPPELRHHPAVRLLNFTPNYGRFLRRFANAQFDIGLAPMREDLFHAAKCHNKFREYAAARVAGIYSNVSVYSSAVEHEQTGLLVENRPGAWRTAMIRLIEDRALREQIQAAAFATARERYQTASNDLVWLAHIKQVLEKSDRKVVSVAGAQLARRLGFAGLVRRVAGRTLLLGKILAREGIGRSFQWGLLYGSTVSQLVRIRIGLRHRPAAQLEPK